jgi:hypothetical protein
MISGRPVPSALTCIIRLISLPIFSNIFGLISLMADSLEGAES